MRKNRRGSFKKDEPYWTQERIIEAIQAWTRKHGAPPTTTDWYRATEDHPSFSTLYRSSGGRFESWAEAMGAAGYEVGRGISPRPRKLPKRTREQRIADLHKALEDQE